MYKFDDNYVVDKVNDAVKFFNKKRKVYVIKFNGKEIQNIPPSKGGYYLSKRAASCALTHFIKNILKHLDFLGSTQDNITSPYLYHDKVFNVRYDIHQYMIKEAKNLFTIEEVEIGYE